MLQQENSVVPQKKSWLLTVAITAFVVTSAFSIFFGFRKSSLEGEINRLQAQKKQLESQENTSTMNARARALEIKNKIEALEKTQISWSKITEKIDKTIPTEKESGKRLVQFRSYNGNAEGKISVSAATNSDSADPFNDIAQTIRAFSADGSFINIFVPSITRSLTQDGSIVLSFSMTFTYQQPTL